MQSHKINGLTYIFFLNGHFKLFLCNEMQISYISNKKKSLLLMNIYTIHIHYTVVNRVGFNGKLGRAVNIRKQLTEIDIVISTGRISMK